MLPPPHAPHLVLSYCICLIAHILKVAVAVAPAAKSRWNFWPDVGVNLLSNIMILHWWCMWFWQYFWHYIYTYTVFLWKSVLHFKYLCCEDEQQARLQVVFYLSIGFRWEELNSGPRHRTGACLAGCIDNFGLLWLVGNNQLFHISRLSAGSLLWSCSSRSAAMKSVT